MISDDIYQELARFMDTLPQGFPATEAGIEIQLLKMVFEPDEADLFCALKLTPESAAQIAERTGRSKKSLEDLLGRMEAKGQIMVLPVDGSNRYRFEHWNSIHDFQVTTPSAAPVVIFRERRMPMASRWPEVSKINS